MFVSWLIQFTFKFFQDSAVVSAIGIIGGNDGPTSVFITSKGVYLILNNIHWIFGFLLLMILYKPFKKLIKAQ